MVQVIIEKHYGMRYTYIDMFLTLEKRYRLTNGGGNSA